MTTTQNTNKHDDVAATEATETTETRWEVGTLVHVAPDTLLIERNIRTLPKDAKFKALVASIKAHGVQTPITARIQENGALVVKMGQRRTLAAIEAARDTVPVWIQDHDSTETDDEIARMITQRDENHHRSGLTLNDEVARCATSAGCRRGARPRRPAGAGGRRAGTARSRAHPRR